MKRTNNYFVIHNFNTVPENLLEYCENYVIYDASTDEKVREAMTQKNIPFLSIKNTGHNITTYFQYFADFYEELPAVVCLTKGNMIGRHCTKDYFDKVYDNQYFTYLFEERVNRKKFEKQSEATSKSAFFLSESQYLEQNTSWYAESPNHPHKYFDDYDDLLKFVYKDPIIPQYCLFSPGACFIVRREQIQKHTKEFYLNLIKIMNYDLKPNFPSEAHQIERMLPTIFEASYEENSWMNDLGEFTREIEKRIPLMQQRDAMRGKRFKRIRRMFGGFA